MESEAQGDDLNGSLETEYSNKVGLRVVLQRRHTQSKRAAGGGAFSVEGKSAPSEARREGGRC